VTLDDRTFINFAGSTYLALGGLAELRDAALEAVRSGLAFSSQLPVAYGSHDPAINDLEITAAAYCCTEAAVYLASGYFIGAAALMSLDTDKSALFLDESAHFSLYDAARLTARPIFTFGHCDPEALTQTVKNNLPPGMQPIVISDGVFATTGRVAPLDQYAAALADYDGRLVVDEAHSFGILGTHGRGAAEHHEVESITANAATLSKAFCAQGAIIGCRREAADRLRRLPPLRGANAGSPVSAAVGAASIRYMQAHPERRLQLRKSTQYLRKRLHGIGIDTGASPAPIVAFQIGDRALMESIQERLLQRGIYVLLSNYLGAGAEGIIRCAVFADHTETDLDALVDELARY